MGLRDDTFNSSRRPIRREQTIFMGYEVWAWELVGPERDQVEAGRWKTDIKAEKAELCMVGERVRVVLLGTRETGEDDARRVYLPGDEMYLNKLPSEELDRVYSVVMRLSGLDAQSREDARKNSEKAAGGVSSTASPATSAGPASNGALAASAAAS